MPNGFLRDVCFILLNIVDFLLNIVYFVFCGLFSLSGLFLQRFLYINMIEASKKRKRSDNDQANLTVASRGLIDANWQKFLASNLIMDTKTEKPVAKAPKDSFTGTFRRARRKKTKTNNNVNNVQNDNKSANTSPANGLGLNTLNLTAQNPDSPVKDAKNIQAKTTNKNNLNDKSSKITKFIAMDCEMVGIGYNGDDHMLARVSLVNKFGDCIYDRFVKPREEVVDYRTTISGVRREDLLNGEEFAKVQKEVSELIKGRILVGHSLKNDLSVLFLSHPKRCIRDTARYKPFRKITKGSTPSLKRLSKEILGIEIQSGEHSSVEDARAAMQLYCTVSKEWETGLSQKRGYRRADSQ